MKDLTKNYDYKRLVKEEKEFYSHVEVTKDLREGGVHASSAWVYYWKRVNQVIFRSQFADVVGYLSRTVPQLGRPIEILSLGSGYCGNELDYARSMRHPYRISCTDINAGLFEKAKGVAREEGLHLQFEETDLNFMTIQPEKYDLIYAHASIHHVINLQRLFEQIAKGLTDQGIFHLVEVVGEDRVLIWDESARFLNALLGLAPSRIAQAHRLNSGQRPGIRTQLKRYARRFLKRPVEVRGMEGIKQSEIIPLLHQFFSPLFEHRHGAFMRFICTDEALSSCLNPQDPDVVRYLDFLIETDDAAVRNGVLKPLEIWGVYRPRLTPAGIP